MSSTPPLRAESLFAHADALRTLARALTWDEATAEDLVQETWLIALEKQPQARDGLGPWLRAVLRRRAQHRRRSESARREREESVSQPERGASVEDRKSIVSALANELMQLDEPYQTTLFLRFFEGRKVREIAQHYDTTTGTVGARIHRGLELMRRRLDARSDGKRESWLGALAPFADPNLRGLIMTGNAKIGVAAAALCAVMFFVLNERGVDSAPATLDAPSKQVLAQVDITPPETVLAPVRPEKPRPEKQAETAVPPAEPARTEPTVVTPPVEIEPPPEVVPLDLRRKIKRKFALELRFDREGSDSVHNLPDGTIIATSLDWTHKQEITVNDHFDDAFYEEADFVRRFSGDWRSDIDIQLNVNEQGWQPISKLKTTGRSPLEKRKLRFHLDQEQGWLVTPLQTKLSDPSDLTSGLRAELDLESLKPPEGVYPGDRWAAEGDPLRELFQPGGDLRVKYTRGGAGRAQRADALVGIEDALVLFGTPTGQLMMTSTGVGTRSARLTEDFSAELTVSFVNEIHLDREKTGTSAFEPFQQRFEFNGTGDGSWDSQAGFISELSLKGEVTIVRTMKQVGSDDHEGRFHGTFKLSVNTSM